MSKQITTLDITQAFEALVEIPEVDYMKRAYELQIIRGKDPAMYDIIDDYVSNTLGNLFNSFKDSCNE